MLTDLKEAGVKVSLFSSGTYKKMTKKVSIVGAGPAGLLLALYLLRRQNYEIEIFELRNDPRTTENLGRSNYPLILCQRGIAACRQIDRLESAIKSAGVEVEGAICFNNNRREFKSDRQKLVSIDRKTLAIALIEHIEANYDRDRIKIHFAHKYVGTDLLQQRASFERVHSAASGLEKFLTFDYDLLIGADGVHSKVRSGLSEVGIEFDKEPTYLNYKSLFLNNLTQNTKDSLELGRVYGWRSPEGVTLLASKRKDATVGCTLFVPTDNQSLDRLQSPETVIDYFQTNFKAIASSISPSEATGFLQQDLAKIWTVSGDRYHYRNSVLIIGDAAHAISPSIGQGCNSALEDVAVIDTLLDKFDDDWTKVLPEYSQTRVADAHAVRELADHALPLTKVMFVLFIIKLTINRALHRLFPKLFTLPFFDLIPHTTIAYSEIHRSAQHWIALVKKTNERYLNRV